MKVFQRQRLEKTKKERGRKSEIEREVSEIGKMELDSFFSVKVFNLIHVMLVKRTVVENKSKDGKPGRIFDVFALNKGKS